MAFVATSWSRALSRPLNCRTEAATGGVLELEFDGDVRVAIKGHDDGVVAKPFLRHLGMDTINQREEVPRWRGQAVLRRSVTGARDQFTLTSVPSLSPRDGVDDAAVRRPAHPRR